MGLAWLSKPVTLFTAISTAALTTLGLLSRKYQRARFYWHLLLYVSTLGFISAWGVVVSIFVAAAGERFSIQHYVGRSFYDLVTPMINVTFEIEGEEHLNNLATAREGKQQSAVLVGNHQSFLDILYLGRIFPKRASIMAKKELKWAPFLGQFMSLSGTVFVNRSNRTDAVRALELAGQDMKKKGVSLWIFPEGTRSSSPEATLLPFKKGAFHLAVQAQVPIVPIVCENYHRLFNGKTRFESGVLKIRVLPPIQTTGLTSEDVTALAESTRESMLQALREISSPGPESSSSITNDAAAVQAPVAPPITTDPPAVDPIHMEISQSGLHHRGELKRTVSSEGSENKSASGNEGKGDETTEDEMDDDAVLMRKPTGV